MPRPKSIPTSLDIKKLGEMLEPLKVRLTRDRQGAPPEPIRLPKEDLTKEEVRGVEQFVNSYSGGGSYHLQVEDAKGEILEYRFFLPTKSFVPAELQLEAARGAQSAQAAGLFVAQGGAPPAAPIGAGVNPWAAGQWGAPPQPPQPQWAPSGQQPQQPWPPAQFPPQMGPFGPPPGSPWGQQQLPPWAFDQWGRSLPPQQIQAMMASMSPWGIAPPLPPPVAPQSSGGIPSGIEQKLAALEQQNQLLREDAIRRQNNDQVATLANKIDQVITTSNQRFEALIASLRESQKPSGNDDYKLDLLRLENDRKAEMARLEQQRRDDAAAAQRALDLQRQEAREREDRILRELAEARSKTEQAGTTALVTQMMNQNANTQQAAAQSNKETISMLQPHLMTPDKLVSIFKETNPNKENTITEKLANAFLQTAMEGGQGGWPQAAVQISGAMMDSASKITGAVFEAKGKEAQMKALSEARAQQQLAGVAQRAAPNRQVAQGNGAQQAQASSQASTAPPSAPNPGAPIDANGTELTAQKILEDEERVYFGPAYEPVLKLRAAHEAGVFEKTPSPAGAIAETLVSAYTYFAIGMGMEPPVIKDLDDEDFEKVIRRVLPDAPGPLRHQIIEELGPRLHAAEQAAQAQMDAAEAQQSDNGAPPQGSAEVGSPANEGVA